MSDIDLSGKRYNDTEINTFRNLFLLLRDLGNTEQDAKEWVEKALLCRFRDTSLGRIVRSAEPDSGDCPSSFDHKEK